MPKRTSAAYESDDGFVEPDDGAPASKRSKTRNVPPTMKAKDGSLVDDDGNQFWQLNEKGTRRITVNEFKGKQMVNIREYYEKEDKMLPGKKGISLTLEQYEALIEAMPAIENVLSAKGQSVARPNYAAQTEADMADANANDAVENDDDEVKKNFEATSEEED